MSNPVCYGRVVRLFTGHGFLLGDDGQDYMFPGATADEFQSLHVQDRVMFIPKEQPDGRLRALGVKKAPDPGQTPGAHLETTTGYRP